MKKLLLSLGIAISLANVSPQEVSAEKFYRLGDAIEQADFTSLAGQDVKVVIEGYSRMTKGYVHVDAAANGELLFGRKTADKNAESVFEEDYIYTISVNEDGTFYMKNSLGAYLPIPTTSSTSVHMFSSLMSTDGAVILRAGATPAITTPSISDYYMLESTNDAVNNSNKLQVHFAGAGDGNPDAVCFYATGAGGKQDAGGLAGNGNNTRTAAAIKLYQVVEVQPVEVTVNYPSFGAYTPAPYVGHYMPGTNLTLADIPAVEYFTATGLDGGVVGDGPTTLNVTGTWAFPFELDRVYRLDIRKKTTQLVVNPATKGIVTNSADGARFDPKSLFYLKGNGFNSDNRLTVTLHSICFDDTQGIYCEAPSGNDALTTFSDEPTQWVVKVSTTGSEGIALQHPDNANTHVNDINNSLGVWNNGSSQNNDGSFIRFIELTEADFATTTWTHDGLSFDLDETKRNTAKANPSSANLRDIFYFPTMTLTFKRNADDTNPLVEDHLVPQGLTEFPVYEGFTLQTTGTLVENNYMATYVMNEGIRMRFYNERAGQYVFISPDANGNNLGLRQTASHDDPTTVFYRIPMDNDGGFAIYSQAQDKFVGNIGGTNSVTTVVDFTSTPVKYYTGKQTTPVYMDWIGVMKAENATSTDYEFFNDNANGGGVRYVCGYSWNDPGSKWVIVTNQEAFDENWEMRDDLIAAKAAYLAALNKVGLEPDNTLVDFATNFVFDGNVNIPLSQATKDKYQALLTAIDEAGAIWPSKLMESTDLYTIVSSDGRGALIYNPDGGTNTMTTVTTVDSSNDNHLWGFVKVDDKFYLYNYGAKKFASAYIYHEGASQTGAVYAWSVSDIPTAIELSNDAFGNAAALNSNQFVIKGGKPGATNPAGIMIINGDATRVPCALGNNDITDGTGLRMTKVEREDAAPDAEMREKVAAGFAMVSDRVDEIGTLGFEYDADTHGKTVAHYTAEAVNTFGTEIAAAKEEAAKEDSDKQAVMYMALDAKAKLNAAESKVQIASGSVYTISDSDGNTHYTDGTGHQIGQFNNANLSYRNWIATVGENGVVSFHHNHDAGEVQVAGLYYDAAAIPFALDGVSSFKVQPAAELGKVNLLNAENNTRVGDKTYSIGYVSSEAKDATTSISEINVDANGRDAIYDLQGRKLAAPAKGINIINGKKVLVK